MAIAALTTSMLVVGLNRLAMAVRLESERSSVLSLFTEARRRSYRLGHTVSVRRTGNNGLEASDGGKVVARRLLSPGFSIAAWPRRAQIHFYQSGLADNATITVRAPSGHQARVVVNQRAMLR